MCSKLAPPPPPLPPSLKPRTNPRIRKKPAAATLRSPARKTRSKTRKPKYLSLRLELSQDSSSQMTYTTTTTTTSTTSDHHHQLNLFPLHPENLVDQDRLLDTHDLPGHNMAASFFSAADDGAATTLTGLLSSAVTLTNSSDEENLSPSSLNYGAEYSTEEGEHNELVRTAMRGNKERDGSTEEKWVCYSEVVEEVSSSSACAAAGKQRRWNGSNKNQKAAVVVEQQQRRRLSLKLDYNEIMNAWSDKGPLYINRSTDNNSAMDIQMDSPQTVPDLLHEYDDDFFSCSPAVNNGGLWRVPQMSGDAGGVGGQSQREASVQRYKEKRQNRLFAKKIRYQVRKLNAEKRPRIKGRFVKRI